MSISQTPFAKIDRSTIDINHAEWSKELKSAIDYIEGAFKASFTGDASWQPIMLGAMLKNKKTLLEQDSISATELYDNIIIPFYTFENIRLPPHSRRTNFIGRRLGNVFNTEGPFTFGGYSSSGKVLSDNNWTLRSIYQNNIIWDVINYYWEKRKINGFTQTDRSRQAEIDAGNFLADDFSGFARLDIHVRAEDAGVDGKAFFNGVMIPAQVKNFIISKTEIHSYMTNEPMYLNGGALICEGVKPEVFNYLEGKTGLFDIEILEITRKNMLTSIITTKYIIKWLIKQ